MKSWEFHNVEYRDKISMRVNRVSIGEFVWAFHHLG